MGIRASKVIPTKEIPNAVPIKKRTKLQQIKDITKKIIKEYNLQKIFTYVRIADDLIYVGGPYGIFRFFLEDDDRTLYLKDAHQKQEGVGIGSVQYALFLKICIKMRMYVSIDHVYAKSKGVRNRLSRKEPASYRVIRHYLRKDPSLFTKYESIFMYKIVTYASYTDILPDEVNKALRKPLGAVTVKNNRYNNMQKLTENKQKFIPSYKYNSNNLYIHLEIDPNEPIITKLLALGFEHNLSKYKLEFKEGKHVYLTVYKTLHERFIILRVRFVNEWYESYNNEERKRENVKNALLHQTEITRKMHLILNILEGRILKTMIM
jgi:hypothetical protein